MDKKTKIRKGPLGLIGLVIVVIGHSDYLFDNQRQSESRSGPARRF